MRKTTDVPQRGQVTRDAMTAIHGETKVRVERNKVHHAGQVDDPVEGAHQRVVCKGHVGQKCQMGNGLQCAGDLIVV